MKFFGKFEIDENNKIYRTKTYLCLDSTSNIDQPNNSQIIGTIFMLNPGSSKPLGSCDEEPFKNYRFNQYVELESDKTMEVLASNIEVLKNKHRYKYGIIEIKNLFNYRNANLSKKDILSFKNDIQTNKNKYNINLSPSFHGDFVFFAWGASKLNNNAFREYAKKIFIKANQDNKNIMYISSRNKKDAENELSFYHPLGGRWCSEKRERFNNNITQCFFNKTAVVNFN